MMRIDIIIILSKSMNIYVNTNWYDEIVYIILLDLTYIYIYKVSDTKLFTSNVFNYFTKLIYPSSTDL